jgi:hypothetical protein
MVLVTVLGLGAGCAEAPREPEGPERVAVFEPACRGEALSGAVAYPAGGTPHLIVVIGAHANTTYVPEIPQEWQAATVGDAQLVACLDVSAESVERCSYLNGPDIVRRHYTIAVDLRAARTGEPVASTVIDGGLPPPCPQTTGVNVFALGSPPFDELADWLGPRVTGAN